VSSAHATNMQERARRLLWRSHAERVTVTEGGAAREVDGIWRRVEPEGASTDGAGATGYQGDAKVVVKAADFEELPGANALVNRNGEDWSIQHAERQDEWTWIFHLARPDADVRMPARLRK
jgi:hypothetical protein